MTSAARAAFVMAAVTAALMAVGTHGAVHEVVEWSANYGYCKTQPPRRLAIPTVEAVVGDAVHFKFSVNSAWNMDATQWAGHEVYKYGTKEAWESCAQDISETPTRLVAWGTMGGNCTGDYPHACMVNSKGHVIEIDTVGTEYYAAEYTLCKKGVKVLVNVNKEAPTASLAPVSIEVPNWTDDYGYCGGRTIPRPFDLKPIYAHDGDTLVFKYATKHNVYLARDEAAYLACDKSRMELVGDVMAGGGCNGDASLAADGGDGCIPNSEGFKFKLDMNDRRATALGNQQGGKLYFVCQIHDHCANGQKVVVTVMPRPTVAADESAGGGTAPSSPAAPKTKNDTVLVVFFVILVVIVLGQFFHICRVRTRVAGSRARMADFVDKKRPVTQLTEIGVVDPSSSV